MRGVFSLSRPRSSGPVVLWGGAQPSGSLKYLTFARYLAAMPPGSRGLVELSGASSALALEVLGRERGLPMVALTDAAGGCGRGGGCKQVAQASGTVRTTT